MIAAMLLVLQSQAQVPALQVHIPTPPDQVILPRQLHMPPVARYYPPEAMRKDEQGVTVLKCVLDTTGRLVNCTVRTSSGSAALDAAAFRVARDARYTPQLVGGKPVAVTVHLPVRWVLAD